MLLDSGPTTFCMPVPVYPAGTIATAFLFFADLLEDARSSLPLVQLAKPVRPTTVCVKPWGRSFLSQPCTEHRQGRVRLGLVGEAWIAGELFRQHCRAAYLCPLVRGPKIQNKTMLDEPKRGKGGTSNHPRSQQDSHGDANVGAAHTQEPDAIPGFQGQRPGQASEQRPCMA